MKLVKHSTLILLTVLMGLISCSDDDTTTSSSDANQLEDISIDTSVLDSGITVEGASKENGTPPATNASFDFTVNTDLTTGIQEIGTSIQFSTDDNIAGAYVQFQDGEGNAANGYFDVPSNALLSAKKGAHNKRKSPSSAFARANDYDFEINVTFTDEIPAGTFCYAICVYDDEGNVGQIEEVCVTVEAWGGSDELAGEWVYDRAEPAGEDDEVEVYTVECTNGESFTANEIADFDYEWIFVLNADGTYNETYNWSGDVLDYETSVENCEAVYVEGMPYSEKYTGNWAYNEDDGTLTVVDFAYEDLLNPDNNEVYEEGELYFEGVSASVVNDELVLSEVFDGETYSIYFRRR